MTDRLLTDDELRAIEEYASKHAMHTCKRLLADLRRYRGWCRRLVACYAGNCDGIGFVELLHEVRAALEGK